VERRENKREWKLMEGKRMKGRERVLRNRTEWKIQEGEWLRMNG
jgi:hypothetical protein